MPVVRFDMENVGKGAGWFGADRARKAAINGVWDEREREMIWLAIALLCGVNAWQLGKIWNLEDRVKYLDRAIYQFVDFGSGEGI